MFFSRKRKDQDLDEEIASHLRMAEQDFGRDGARRDFGNIGLVKEVTREIWVSRRGNVCGETCVTLCAS